MREARRPPVLGAPGVPTRMLRALVACGALALAIALLGSASAHAQTPAPAKVLVFTGPQDATTDAGVAAIRQLGTANGFGVDATADPAPYFTAAGLDLYRSVVFLNTAGDLLDAAEEGALETFIEDGGWSSAGGSAAQSEVGSEWFDGLIGARPSATSPTATSEQTVAVGDRVHPSTRKLALRVAPHRRLVPVADPPDRERAHRRPLPRAERRRR